MASNHVTVGGGVLFLKFQLNPAFVDYEDMNRVFIMSLCEEAEKGMSHL